jgi:hypothetical protein
MITGLTGRMGSSLGRCDVSSGHITIQGAIPVPFFIMKLKQPVVADMQCSAYTNEREYPDRKIKGRFTSLDRCNF